MKKTLLATFVEVFLFGVVGASGTQDANAWLTSAYRSDLVGPEVWTCPNSDHRVRGDEKDLAQKYWNQNVPFRQIGLPSPGMDGKLHVVHEVTNANAAVTLEFLEDGRAKVDFIPVRNRWTPSFITTHYRSIPTGLSKGERRGVGRIVLKETKAILEDNTFLAETTVKNTSASQLVCRVSVKTHGGLPAPGAPAKVWNFTTRSMSRNTDRVACAAAVASFGGGDSDLEVPPHGEVVFRYALAFSPMSPADAERRAKRALGDANAFGNNARAFNEWFSANVPSLETGDPDLMRMYLYRWFVVKRGTHEARRVIADHEYPRPAVYESPVGRFYDCVIGLPVPLHVQEVAWERNADVLHSEVLNWCDGVKGYRDYIQFTGMAIARSLENHPSPEFAKKILPSVVDYARKSTGGDPSKLPIQDGSWGTGAEYQPNFYQFTDPPWDFRNDYEFARKDKSFKIAKIVRLDTAVYAIGNMLGAAKIAKMAGDDALAADIRAFADSQAEIIRSRHWDDSIGLFLAADPVTYRLADKAACYDSFAPFLWGVVRDEKYMRAFDKLTDRAWFWDDFPVSTCAKTCPMYCGENAIVTPPASVANPHLYGCSWNGPTWHYSNSLVAEAFGQAARRKRSLRGKWLEFFDAWTEMHWLYGDRTVPRAAESVRPEDGVRCCAAWDYFHSSWLDPFFRYRCGIALSEDGRTIRFDPFAASDFRLSNVPLAGREYMFEQCMDGGVRRLSVRDGDGNILASGRDFVSVEVLQR